MTSRQRQILFWIIPSAVSLFVALVVGEIFLRLMGYEVRARFNPQPDPIYVMDDVLGYSKLEGSHVVRPYYNPSIELRVTHWPGNLRATSPTYRPGTRPAILFLGGSFMNGEGLSDEETAAWKLQTALPDYFVMNAGTSGHGTYQSLLQLEAMSTQTQLEHVIYGMIFHHRKRNVGEAEWLRTGARNGVVIPYVDMAEDGSLVRIPPTPYPKMPLSHYSALMALIEHSSVQMAAAGRVEKSQDIFLELMKRIQENASSRGAKFSVMLFSDKKQNDLFVKRMKSNSINVIDCSLDISRFGIVENDPSRHPGAEANSAYAECLREQLM